MKTLSNKRPDNASCFCFGKFSSRQVICTRLQVICTRLSNSLTLHLRKNSLSLKKDPFFHFTKHHKKKNRSLRRRQRQAPLLSAQRESLRSEGMFLFPDSSFRDGPCGVMRWATAAALLQAARLHFCRHFLHFQCHLLHWSIAPRDVS